MLGTIFDVFFSRLKQGCGAYFLALFLGKISFYVRGSFCCFVTGFAFVL